MRFCGNCKYFIPHNYKYNYKRRVVAGWWVGDGKCKLENKSKRKYTVLGSTCQYFKEKD